MPISERQQVTVSDPAARARALAKMLDSAIRIPGTSVTLGLDPILGLFPGLGDLAGAALSLTGRSASAHVLTAAEVAAGFASRAQIFAAFGGGAGWNPTPE